MLAHSVGNGALPPPIHSLGQIPAQIQQGSLSMVDRLCTMYPGRGIDNFFVPGGAQNAAQALSTAQSVVILTGFNVAEGMPETDGPPGAAVLANALAKLGVKVTLVTDSTSSPIMSACYNALDPTWENVALQVFDARRDDPAADKRALNLLTHTNADAVVAIELPAHTENDGPPSNMRGVDIGGFNAPLDKIMEAANHSAQVRFTVGVGDGGNEAGMGVLAPRIPLASDGRTVMASAVMADYPVTAFNSNLGAQAMAAYLLHAAGRVNELTTGDQLTQITAAALNAGAVDGVTRGRTMGEPGPVEPFETGVDGFHPRIHAGILDSLRIAVTL